MALDDPRGGHRREFTNLWRTRQFEYSWLRSITGRDVDLLTVTEQAMVCTANALKLELTSADRSNAKHAGLTDVFEALVSTDENRTYKPDPRAYQLGVDRLRLARDLILFAAFGSWDAAGAKAFGYPTMWVNRLKQPADELSVRPDCTSPDLQGLLDLVLGGAQEQLARN